MTFRNIDRREELSIIKLTNAIGNLDVVTVQRLLNAHRDNLSNIVNNLPSGTALHAVLFQLNQLALWPQDPEVDRTKRTAIRTLMQIFLNFRDRNNNLIVNLNYRNVNAGTVLSLAIDAGSSEIVQQILDARNGDGSLAVNLLGEGQHGTFFSPLTRALLLNKLEIVQLLVDARNADGTFILSEEDKHNALVGAHVVGVPVIVNNASTRWLHEQLRNPIHPIYRIQLDEAIPPGIRRKVAPQPVAPRQLQVARPIIAERPPQPIPQQAVPQFHEAKQNTHDTEVVVSIETSVKRLMNRYPNVNATGTLPKIKKFIDELPTDKNIKNSIAQKIKSAALQRYQDLGKINIKREGLGLTLQDMLALTWTAAEDKNAVVEGVEAPLSDKDIIDRKRSIVIGLKEAQTEYPTTPACFVGTFNKIVESLDRAHPDVLIIKGKDRIRSVAMLRATDITKKILSTKTPSEQLNILKDWDSEEALSPFNAFKQEVEKNLEEKLAEEFQTLLGVDMLDQVKMGIFQQSRSVFVELPALRKAIEDIDSIFYTGDNEDKRSAINYIKHQLHISLEQESAQKALEYLSSKINVETYLAAYNNLNSIAESIKNIRAQYTGSNRRILFAIKKCEIAVNAAFFSLRAGVNSETCLENLKADCVALPALRKAIEDIDSIFYTGNDHDQCSAINYIKQQLDISLEKESAQKALEYLSSKINVETYLAAYNNLNSIAESIKNIRAQYTGSNRRRLFAIKKCEIAVDAAFFSLRTGVNSETCLKHLKSQLIAIKQSIINDHQEHGALRWFNLFRLQPKSRLINIMDNENHFPKTPAAYRR